MNRSIFALALAGLLLSSGAFAEPVNINTADARTLAKELSGIGLSRAQAIVEYREKNGPFKKIEELMNVRGVGEKNFLKLKPLVTLGQPKTEKGSPGL